MYSDLVEWPTVSAAEWRENILNSSDHGFEPTLTLTTCKVLQHRPRISITVDFYLAVKIHVVYEES